VIDLEDHYGLPAEQSMDILNYLLGEGMLDEEPAYSTSDQSISPRGLGPLETKPVLAPT
jgi:hypothetical protein